MGQGEEQVKVLSLWCSPFSMRVLIGLEEKAVTYEYQEENLDPKSDLLLQMNPINKTVPVLIHDGKPVNESLIILEYIDETWPSSNRFMPSNPYDRAVARFWADFLNKKFFEDAFYGILKNEGEALEEGKRCMLKYLGFLEGELSAGGGKPYFGGEQFGYLDIAFIPYACWFHSFETFGKWKIPWEIEFPRLQVWMKKSMERDSVKKVLPNPVKVLEYAIEYRKTFITSE
eukprot:PITA_11061